MATGTNGPRYEPYIASSNTTLREGTVRAVVVGTVLGMLFGASSLYLVLKTGLTVSASIPVAVISITLFKILSKVGVRDATILENNISQTAGSAGESLAFGVGATMPAIMILGFDLDIWRVTLVSVLGGLLGVLMMIPLRRALIVQQHGILKYPEGTACAEVLKAGASVESQAAAAPGWKEAAASAAARGTNALTIFAGFVIGIVYKTAHIAFKGWKEAPGHTFGAPLKAGSVNVEVSPELLGVGYIIGPRIAATMAAGGILAYLVLIPMIAFFGEAATSPISPAGKLIKDMSPSDIRGEYILYIGAGAVAAAGIMSVFQSLPLIWHGLKEGLRDVGGKKGAAPAHARTARDLPLSFVIWGSMVLMLMIMFAPGLHMNVVGALLIVVFGFLFVTVSSRLTGEIGSSSNPISGMTVATLLLTCLIFLALGWTGGTHYVTALSVGAIVCIAASNGGTTSQDLKTGYLVGGTPRVQQIALLIGVFASALILGPILLKLNDSQTVYIPAGEIAQGLKTDPSTLTARETLGGRQTGADTNYYKVWHKTDTAGGPAGKYLVDEAGSAVWLVDPGINGVYTKTPDGQDVQKFDAPKAVLMSYVIKGILDRQLPWALVLFGVGIAIMLQMAGVPALAFAVGVYLPLSTSAPIFIGGAIRWIVDLKRRRELLSHNMSEDELTADADRSPGVLAASGYIAGGAIAGILIAIMAGGFGSLEKRIYEWSVQSNPFYEGPMSDILAFIPFALIVGFLYLVAREKILSKKSA